MAKMKIEDLSKEILDDLNQNATNIVNGIESLSSPRTVADAVQSYLANTGLKNILKAKGITLKTDFTRRAMADMAFTDSDGNYYAIDVKTHNKGTVCNMPNLVSVKRLADFYTNPKNSFCILIISYNVNVVNNQLSYIACDFKPIESFSWDCLTLGALGWGQIQIKNANTLNFEKVTCRKEWMETMCKKVETFYNREVKKIINNRKQYFQKIANKSNW